MLEFHGTILNGKLAFPQEQLELRVQWLTTLKNGARVVERLTKESRAKSHNQVKAHFGLVIGMIRNKMIDMGWGVCGIAPNKDMIHDILKRACGGVGDGGEVLGLSDMSTTQASLFFENCRDWAATQLNIVIPDPDKNWRNNDTDKV